MNRILSLGAASLVGLGLAGCGSGADGKVGLDGKASLVRIDNESAGANCATGGMAIKVGIDANSDGQLNDTEVNSSLTQFVCNGPKGADGSNKTSPKALTVAIPEPRGVNCAYGGFFIQTGLDDNNNNTLDAEEVRSFQYVCETTSLDTVYFGNVTVTRPEDLEVLKGIEVVIGSIYVPLGTIETLDLPDLKVVTHDLVPSAYSDEEPPAEGVKQLTSLNLPALRRVGGEFGIVYSKLTSLSLPSLEEAPEDFYLYATPIETVSLPKLTIVTDMDFGGNELLQEIHAPKLERVFDGVEISWAPVLTTVDFPALTAVNAFEVRDTALTTLTLPALTRTGELRLSNNEALTEVHAPALTSMEANIDNNPVLTTLDFPVLANAYGEVYGNQELGECTIATLNHDLFLRGSRDLLVDRGGNKDETCSRDILCPELTIAGATGSYRQCLVSKAYADARADCQANGADLVVFDDATEYNAFAAAAVAGKILQNSTIGYTDAAVEGTWVWVTNVSGYVPGPAAPFWHPGEPNNAYDWGTGHDEDCAQLMSNGRVNDIRCSAQLGYICEAAPPP
jgi:hypothetical protein